MSSVLRPTALALLIISLTTLPLTPPAEADRAGRQRFASGDDIVEYKGRMKLTTDPPYVVGEGFVRGLQIGSTDPSRDFLAIGVSKGLGTWEGFTNCADDYDPDWDIYVDGRINGAYFCRIVAPDAVPGGTNPAFRLKRVTDSEGVGWSLNMKGAERALVRRSYYAESVVGMLETTPSGPVPDRNLDVRFSDLFLRTLLDDTWKNFGSGQEVLVGPSSYQTHVNSPNAFDAFLPPLTP